VSFLGHASLQANAVDQNWVTRRYVNRYVNRSTYVD